ncbi:MAG: hypothetical protein LBR28_05950 [Bacteroidales bacterium]|nr:hypothetical protein [Bacteroidales bacterium]
MSIIFTNTNREISMISISSSTGSTTVPALVFIYKMRHIPFNREILNIIENEIATFVEKNNKQSINTVR